MRDKVVWQVSGGRPLGKTLDSTRYVRVAKAQPLSLSLTQCIYQTRSLRCCCQIFPSITALRESTVPLPMLDNARPCHPASTGS